MSDVKPENQDVQEIKETPQAQEPLSPTGQRSMQGIEPAAQDGTKSGKPEWISSDPGLQKELDEWNRTHDPANWDYRLGSPHADYQAAKDIQQAQSQYELGTQAATADGLGDAVDTTLKASKDTKPTGETPGDKYFREKYGSQPYTTEAYPKEEQE